jgi:hypothetical protein
VQAVPKFSDSDVQQFVTSNSAWGPKLQVDRASSFFTSSQRLLFDCLLCCSHHTQQVSRDAGKVALVSGSAGFLVGAVWVASRCATAARLSLLFFACITLFFF